MARDLSDLEIKKLVASLSQEAKIGLMRELQKISGKHARFPLLSPEILIRVEAWLWEQLKRAKSPFYINARTRVWLIFMLLRYSGLRLTEVLNLNAANCDFTRSLLYVGKRVVPLPPAIGRRIARVWLEWPGKFPENAPLKCDSSHIRHIFSTCARDCAIPTALLNARALRKYRAFELEAGGLHPRLVSWLLGKCATAEPFTQKTAQTIIYHHIQKEQTMRTSARNVFYGEICAIFETDILVKTQLKTKEGLLVTAIITQTSRKSLGLENGKPFYALVKAPWVSVTPMASRASLGEENCFPGRVETIKRDSTACEILANLQTGDQICALYANGANPSSEIRENAEILVSFSPFSVILTAD